MMEMPKARTGITMGELLGACIVIVGVVLTFWKNTDVRLAALEMRMNARERTDEQTSAKLDKLQDGINEIKITLQNKQDKK